MQGFDLDKLKEQERRKQLEERKVKENIISREFEWNDKFFDHMNRTAFNFAKRLVDEGLIKDVYMDMNSMNPAEHKIIIEYYFSCDRDLKDITNAINQLPERRKGKKITQYKIPKDFPIKKESGCQKKDQIGCQYYGCPIILAGYIYHMTRNLHRDVADPNKVVIGEKKQKEKEPLNKVLTTELVQRRKDILAKIDKNIYLDEKVKEEFCRLIRALDNYDSMKSVINHRPSLNFAFTDNTDTIHPLCAAQEECINQYLEILKSFNVIDKDEKPKVVDFKELTEHDFLNNVEENYKQKVIILKNIYLLSIKDGTKIENDRQLNMSIIRSNFPSFIMNNSNDKIFIICDKSVNLKNFYGSFNQLKNIFNTIDIKPLKANDVFDIFMKKIENPSYNGKITLEDNFKDKLKNYIEIHYPYSPYKNLEFVKFLFDSAIESSFNTSHPGLLKVEDFMEFKSNRLEGEAALNELIGLDNVKQEVRNLKAFLEFTRAKEKMGEKMPKLDLHMVYYGNPGTGKTTVARMMADILFNLGYIRYNKCLETEAKDFIANIPGATAMKTNEKIQEALGGVLFIDEAYALGESEYGKECIAALIKSMEDFRDDLVIILAGYHNEMETFLEINSGFKSRVAYYMDFVDYTNEELYQMFEYHFNNYGFEIRDNEVRQRIYQICDMAKRRNSFGNGRFVRQKVDDILRKHAQNSVDQEDEEIRNHIITKEDIDLI